MKIIRLQTMGFKRVTVADITPDGNLIEVRGNNGAGKSSLLDSIKAALGGADAAPIKPVKTGEDYAAIRVTLGDGKPDLIVTKYFDEVGEKLRVETADGAEFKAGQSKVDDLLGRMTFDPLAFARLKPAEQAIELRRIVPLSVDLDQLAAADKADIAARRDVNRDGKAKIAQRDAINVSGIIPEKPDREAIVARLAGAAGVNTAIERERDRRAMHEREREHTLNGAFGCRTEAEKLRARADELVAQAVKMDGQAGAMAEEARAWAPLDEPVDTAALSVELAKADQDLALLARVAERKRLDAEVETLRGQSEAFTAKMVERAKLRETALAEAAMPVPGLGFAAFGDSEDLVVSFEGEPFSQASGAQQLRVSMALAMAANPKLRVMLIKDGSLLDANGLALVRDLAKGGNYQVWLEGVGEGDGTGIIMEAGSVKGAPEAERLAGPKRRKAKGIEETSRPLTDQEKADLTDLSKGTRAIPDGLAVDRKTGETVMIVGEQLEPLPDDRNMLREGSDGLAKTPTRTKPRAMTSFSRGTKPGDLFGGGE